MSAATGVGAMFAYALGMLSTMGSSSIGAVKIKAFERRCVGGRFVLIFVFGRKRRVFGWAGNPFQTAGGEEKDQQHHARMPNPADLIFHKLPARPGSMTGPLLRSDSMKAQHI